MRQRPNRCGRPLARRAFVGSGIEPRPDVARAAELHAGPARYDAFFLCLLGYWANFLVGGLWVVWPGSWRRGRWTRKMRAVLVLSAAFDGAAQALNYVAPDTPARCKKPLSNAARRAVNDAATRAARAASSANSRSAVRSRRRPTRPGSRTTISTTASVAALSATAAQRARMPARARRPLVLSAACAPHRSPAVRARTRNGETDRARLETRTMGRRASSAALRAADGRVARASTAARSRSSRCSSRGARAGRRGADRRAPAQRGGRRRPLAARPRGGRRRGGRSNLSPDR